MPSKIEHISSYLPNNIFSNEEFFELFPEMKSNNYVTKIGVEQRVISSEGETASDMAIAAAKKLFEETKIDPQDIDFLIFSSTDMDYYMPATSCYIHNQLGLLSTCGTIDLTHGCSAYVYALSVAKGMIETNGLKKILVLNSNTLTKKLHPKDKASRFVFGDGAAATLVTYSEEQKIGNCSFGTDSVNWQKIILRDGGERNPLTENSCIDYTDDYGNTTNNAKFYMDGTSVFLFSIKRVPALVKEVLEKNKIGIDDVDVFIFHQANEYIINTIATKLNLPPQKVYVNLKSIGNTVGASIPIAYAQAKAEGKIVAGNKVLLVGFGVGFSLSASLVTV